MTKLSKTRLIMLIDDDDDDRDLFCEAIGEIDALLNCIQLEKGEMALEYLGNSEKPLPDLIFLDMNMPRLNGKQCLVAIRKLDRAKEVPIIIYSTSNSTRDQNMMKELGATGFLHKPNDFITLCDEVKKWIS